MRYRLGGVILESLDPYVRITVRANTENPLVRVTRQEYPTSIQVAELLAEMRGFSLGGLDSAHLQACGRAADDARNSKTELCLS